jgi:2-polyprenyl-3-methyl-5-hydroxy-6-metoxy-1,4-benzoquinol methylase
MVSAVSPTWTPVYDRARQSRGISSVAIYRTVGRLMAERNVSGILVDVGCGEGDLWNSVGAMFSNYIGVDATLYDRFPAAGAFKQANLDLNDIPVPDGVADVVAAVETIEHLENPRQFMRELVRLAKPGGWVLVTTPNQLSFLSLLTLVFKGRFNAFQDVHYPAHLSALIEVDLRRMAAECMLSEVAIAYTLEGRFVFTPWHYPGVLSRCFPCALSDNILIIGRKAFD